jgi:hypothetical protein
MVREGNDLVISYADGDQETVRYENVNLVSKPSTDPAAMAVEDVQITFIERDEIIRDETPLTKNQNLGRKY